MEMLMPALATAGGVAMDARPQKFTSVNVLELAYSAT
jgi:hypothetical protein